MHPLSGVSFAARGMPLAKAKKKTFEEMRRLPQDILTIEAVRPFFQHRLKSLIFNI